MNMNINIAMDTNTIKTNTRTFFFHKNINPECNGDGRPRMVRRQAERRTIKLRHMCVLIFA